MNTKIVAVISGSDVVAMKQQMHTVQTVVDILELRLDQLNDLDIVACRALIKQASLPTLLTLRSSHQGGGFNGSIEEKITLLLALLPAQPTYIDLEYDTPLSEVQRLRQADISVKFICSYHDFKQTPVDLTTILENMQNPIYHYYKIVTQAQTAVDAMRLLKFIKQQTITSYLIAHCMGDCGQFSRLLSPIMGSVFCYVSHAPVEFADGLLKLADLQTIYRVQQFNDHTKIFALLGDPVASSIGHLFHNQFMQQHGLNAVYVKINLHADALTNFFALAKSLNFCAFSVTMPLKQAVLSHLDHIDELAQRMQAVNTIGCDQQGVWHGSNTDGKGALKVLQTKSQVVAKQIWILGAGGSARAIAYELQAAGAQITLLNRTASTAHNYAGCIGCRGGGFDLLTELQHPLPDIIINTVPVLDDMILHQLESLLHLKQALVMDIVYYAKSSTALLDLARCCGCAVMTGQDLFRCQAQYQWHYWEHYGIYSACCTK